MFGQAARQHDLTRLCARCAFEAGTFPGRSAIHSLECTSLTHPVSRYPSSLGVPQRRGTLALGTLARLLSAIQLSMCGHAVLLVEGRRCRAGRQRRGPLAQLVRAQS
jgi:hypothetical protein